MTTAPTSNTAPSAAKMRIFAAETIVAIEGLLRYSPEIKGAISRAIQAEIECSDRAADKVAHKAVQRAAQALLRLKGIA